MIPKSAFFEFFPGSPFFSAGSTRLVSVIKYTLKFMVNVETFMLAQLEHLDACIMKKSHM